MLPFITQLAVWIILDERHTVVVSESTNRCRRFPASDTDPSASELRRKKDIFEIWRAHTPPYIAKVSPHRHRRQAGARAGGRIGRKSELCRKLSMRGLTDHFWLVLLVS